MLAGSGVLLEKWQHFQHLDNVGQPVQMTAKSLQMRKCSVIQQRGLRAPQRGITSALTRCSRSPFD